jgi:hypothetical protein
MSMKTLHRRFRRDCDPFKGVVSNRLFCGQSRLVMKYRPANKHRRASDMRERLRHKGDFE